MEKMILKFVEGRRGVISRLPSGKIVLPRRGWNPRPGEYWEVGIEERDRYAIAYPIRKVNPEEAWTDWKISRFGIFRKNLITDEVQSLSLNEAPPELWPEVVRVLGWDINPRDFKKCWEKRRELELFYHKLPEAVEFGDYVFLKELEGRKLVPVRRETYERIKREQEREKSLVKQVMNLYIAGRIKLIKVGTGWTRYKIEAITPWGTKRIEFDEGFYIPETNDVYSKALAEFLQNYEELACQYLLGRKLAEENKWAYKICALEKETTDEVKKRLTGCPLCGAKIHYEKSRETVYVPPSPDGFRPGSYIDVVAVEARCENGHYLGRATSIRGWNMRFNEKEWEDVSEETLDIDGAIVTLEHIEKHYEYDNAEFHIDKITRKTVIKSIVVKKPHIRPPCDHPTAEFNMPERAKRLLGWGDIFDEVREYTGW